MMVEDTLLTEIERQRKYLERLPDDFQFPLFNARRAAESQRSSAYRNTAAAAREIVDNAIEAGASRVDVVFSNATRGTGKGKRSVVDNIAFIDDGSGMLPEMARYALSWGGGSHDDDPTFIGKFGFGLPNASINQTRRVSVYTRTAPTEPISKITLDIDDFADFGLQIVPAPQGGTLPRFVSKYMEAEEIVFDHGTVVVWEKPDRLTYKTEARLKQELINDFGVVYRYLIRDPEARFDRKALGRIHEVRLLVSGVQLQPIDPLFVTPGARFYEEPVEDAVDRGGAQQVESTVLPLVWLRSEESGETQLLHPADAEQQAEEWVVTGRTAVHIRVSRLPFGFAEEKRGAGPTNAANDRFEIRRTRRGISFVRAGREIDTLDRLPGGRAKDENLGRWPSIQAYAYHWGCEIQFQPDLDDALGIQHDKQGVNPSEAFWRALHSYDVDTWLRNENGWQEEVRKEQRRTRLEANVAIAEQAAVTADAAIGGRPAPPAYRVAQARGALQDAAATLAEEHGIAQSEAEAQLRDQAKERPYEISFFDAEYGPFFEPAWRGTQIVLRINRKHEFFSHAYLPNMANLQARASLDLLLLTLGKAELTAADEQLELTYQAQRTQVWSRFLAVASSALKMSVGARSGAPRDGSLDAEEASN